MGNKPNLLVKLTSALISLSLLVPVAGCANKEERYDEFMVTKENNTHVLHKANDLGDGVYSAYCGVEAKMEAGYQSQPKDYAYDVKCDDCFNND